MGFQKAQGFAKPKKLSAEESMSLWSRRRRRQGLDWLKVDTVLLKAALTAACTAGVSLGFAKAQGNLGVCVTVWDNGVKRQEFGGDADELNELLDEFIDEYSSGSEDLRAMMGGQGLPDQVAAD